MSGMTAGIENVGHDGGQLKTSGMTETGMTMGDRE